ncbi:23S rRNA (pseudouridine(1915)-N(3))-methyltransferase RlmH [Bartonella krasnovii]|uniref:Ribosomal RNA large subunit methyltransferase H n=1 Tax=Bartonella krasnovii TaxID=2267275 RepID=A0A5B9CYX7_9HYPH|nr:23S rRNA (pseudouridine(1915)-N(3))-methyltransferase RlmH [Bartonella krasnovii]QEE11496.1 23S rRNA (pseudouridine(1915)-N(3))-methyltransferase RlmH [Bartonella krasnovii]UNF29251.1 23S rRNA (pseudouridine(1915)-N(3))-methyltransferase RlmH [Bartonella krasnovii]UNF35608.1 23S rRNA (pseudouridine(1915)-N(3))-methyltransferase RlmH [Bartonella krasnovii]UNF37228.1 23S rRNA (pseudouridine(1915)-N(3))-methyltransferase RlmH [Bartonella krasnovii]UNF38922.1 23S rRNA (pseudouridine(1915)-N(3))
MQISIFAVGRMKSGAEQKLVQRYLDRFSKSSGAVGFHLKKLQEIPESRAQTACQRMEEEGRRLVEFLPEKCRLIVLDERGESISSAAFAEKLGCYRDEGVRDIIIALGGPDGHNEQIRNRADFLLSFGFMTWPHQIARILLAEQLYRAVTIANHHPYHRF